MREASYTTFSGDTMQATILTTEFALHGISVKVYFTYDATKKRCKNKGYNVVSYASASLLQPSTILRHCQEFLSGEYRNSLGILEN